MKHAVPGALRSLEYVQQQLGNPSRTTLYKIFHTYKVRIVKVGGKSTVSDAEIHRVIAEATNAPSSEKPRERAKAAAARSVDARRRARGEV